MTKDQYNMNEQINCPEENLRVRALEQVIFLYGTIPIDKREIWSTEDFLKAANKTYNFIKGKQVRSKKSKTNQ